MIKKRNKAVLRLNVPGERKNFQFALLFDHLRVKKTEKRKMHETA